MSNSTEQHFFSQPKVGASKRDAEIAEENSKTYSGLKPGQKDVVLTLRPLRALREMPVCSELLDYAFNTNRF
jgi:hypothetical protein